MNKTSKLAQLGMVLGLSGLGCGTNGTDTGPETNGLPALTAEERAVVDTMEKGTLAEIDLPEGKMRFIEIAPGEVLITRKFAMGAKVTHVNGEDAMTLDQLFHAYAPDREVPRAVLEATARVADAALNADAQPAVVSTGPETFAGKPVVPQTATPPDGTERVTSALASSSDPGWFTQNFCNVGGADFTWCFATAWQGTWAKKRSHRSGSITCGDTGAARTYFRVEGRVTGILDVTYAQCGFIHSHGPHGLFGVNLERDLQHEIGWAEATVRFAGWYADEDQFLSAF